MSAERKGLLRSTAAVIAGSLVGVWWWLRVRAKTNIERPLSSHPYIAIDIVLLPPEQIRKSCYAFNRGITTDYFIFGETRHPHISLIQSLIKEENLQRVIDEFRGVLHGEFLSAAHWNESHELAVTQLRVREEENTCHTQYRVRVPGTDDAGAATEGKRQERRDWLSQLHEALMARTSDIYDEPRKVHEAERARGPAAAGSGGSRLVGNGDGEERQRLLDKMRALVQPDAFFRDRPTDPVTEETLRYVSSFAVLHSRARFDAHITLGRGPAARVAETVRAMRAAQDCVLKRVEVVGLAGGDRGVLSTGSSEQASDAGQVRFRVSAPGQQEAAAEGQSQARGDGTSTESGSQVTMVAHRFCIFQLGSGGTCRRLLYEWDWK